MKESIVEKVGSEKLIALYKHLESELKDLAWQSGVSDLLKYYIPEGRLFKQNYLYRLASSLQNSGHMRNSIKFNDSDVYRSKIEHCLFGFDTLEAVKHYDSGEQVMAALKEKGISVLRTPASEDMETPKQNWEKYCRGLYDGLNFLVNKNGISEIDSLIKDGNIFPENWLNRLVVIRQQIYGMGPALVCDWLKECGCTWLSKPDVHIIEVLSALTGEKINGFEKCVTYIYQWAELIRQSGTDETCTSYKIDKIIWLLCTGDFYLDRKTYGRDKIIEFIRES